MELFHRRLAVVTVSSFFKLKTDRSIPQYFITQGMGQSSMFLTFRTIYKNFSGREFGL